MPPPAPMLAKERKDPFSDPDWAFEVKLDGIRVIAEIKDGKTRLFSRNNIDISYKFPAVVQSLSKLKAGTTVIDGEVVAFDKHGRPSFDRMLERYGLTQTAQVARAEQTNPVEFFVFDVLIDDGTDVRKKPYSERRIILEKLKIFKGPIKLIDSFRGDGEMVYDHARKLGFEGMMAKRLASPYLSGVRSGDWLKIKALHTEEFVIGGYTGGSGARASSFGALLLGKWEDGQLRYVGTSGGGFTTKLLDEILALLKPIETRESAFVGKITADGPHHFVKPIYWAEVSFTAWTTAGRIRLPRFQRLRLDLTGIPAEQKAGAEQPRVRSKASSSARAPLTFEQQLLGLGDGGTVKVDGAEIKLNTLNDELFPATASSASITKRELILYLYRVRDWLIPHLRERPLTWVRFSKGINGPREVHKHWHYRIPEFVPRLKIWSSQRGVATEYITVDNLPTLLWLAQIETIEFHPWYSRVVRDGAPRKAGMDFKSSEDALISSVLNYPDFMVFDLDPYIYSGDESKGGEPEFNEKGFKATKEAALALKALLDAVGIRSYLKSSGKTGLHIYVPLVRNLTYEQTRSLAESFGRQMLRSYPKLITMEWSVPKRRGFVFFDHLQNTRGKTLISLYSPRAVPGGRVAWPVSWSSLTKFSPMDYTMTNAPELLAKHGDAWSKILEDRQDLRALIGKASAFLA